MRHAALATVANDLAVDVASRSNPVAPIDLASLFLVAMGRAGVPQNRMAGILGISESSFSHSFGPNTPERNPLMKLIGCGYPGRSADDEEVMTRVLVEMTVILASRFQIRMNVPHRYIDLCVAFAEAGVELMRAQR